MSPLMEFLIVTKYSEAWLQTRAVFTYTHRGIYYVHKSPNTPRVLFWSPFPSDAVKTEERVIISVQLSWSVLLLEFLKIGLLKVGFLKNLYVPVSSQQKMVGMCWCKHLGLVRCFFPILPTVFHISHKQQCSLVCCQTPSAPAPLLPLSTVHVCTFPLLKKQRPYRGKS